MSPELPVGGGSWTPPFVQPLLRALDRMQQRHAVSPETLTGRALTVLTDRLGSAASAPEATFCHGVLGLAADHTALIDGFALLLPIRDGIAVAIRESNSPSSRLVFEGESEVWSFDATSGTLESRELEEPWWVRVFIEVVKLAGTSGRQVDASVVATIVSGCDRSYGAALALSAFRASEAVFPSNRDESEVHEKLTAAVEKATGQLQTPVYSIATDIASLGQFILVDARSGRRLAFPTPVADPVGWGLVDTGKQLRAGKQLENARQDAAEIAERLRKKHFPNLSSLRDLEHKDLRLAEKAVGRQQRPVLRYLVRENQRVHRLVTAARRGDWQLVGALMVMGHASLAEELSATTEATDFVVAMVEEQFVSGMYGGRALGFSGVAIVAGQPFVVPQFIDSACAALEERFGIAPNTVLL